MPPNDAERLQAELAAARQEVARLQAENDRLRAATPTVPTAPHRSQRAPTLFSPAETVEVGRASLPEEKVHLYRSLFVGRADVYAQRWESTATGKSGWSPVTTSGRGAASTETRQYAPLDDAVIGSHLSGRITAGLYPLTEGDRCQVLVCDFDKGSWMLDALAFVEVCGGLGVPTALERSRSGNGAHVWIFFEQLVEAAVARRLGTGLLRETMALRAEVDLASYDRLFPSQDFVPQRGFGNLIALPLQGSKRKVGNTVFLDPETRVPWDDQWRFLSSVRRLSAADAKSIGEAIRVEAGPGTGTTRRPTQNLPPSPPTIRAWLGPVLAVDRIGLPPALVASLKHLASVHNPEFHQRERLRLSTWNTPRMIRCYDEDLDRLYLPRGLVERQPASSEQQAASSPSTIGGLSSRSMPSLSAGSSAQLRKPQWKTWFATTSGCSWHLRGLARPSWHAP